MGRVIIICKSKKWEVKKLILKIKTKGGSAIINTNNQTTVVLIYLLGSFTVLIFFLLSSWKLSEVAEHTLPYGEKR